MRRPKEIVVMLCAGLLAAAPAAELRAAGPGTFAADTLNIGVGARATAMGGAFTGLADDPSALYWNPAGLSQLLEKEAGFLHSQMFEGVAYENASYAHPHKRLGVWAASFSWLHKSGIASYDEGGASLGSVSAQSSVFSLGWGRQIFAESFAVGASAKFLRDNLAGYSSNGFAVDLGALYTAYENPSLKVTGGLSARNLGTYSAFISEAGQLPRVVTAGVGLKTLDERLAAGFDGVFPAEQTLGHGNFGVEFWLHPQIAVRAGFTLGADSGTGFSTGIGFKARKFEFDYSASDHGALGVVHRGGIAFRFGDSASRLYDEGLSLMRQGNFAEAFLKFNKLLTAEPNDRRAILKMKECRDRVQEELKGLREAEERVK